MTRSRSALALGTALRRTLALLLGLGLTAVATPLYALKGGAASPAPASTAADATPLYNAGTIALDRGAPGPAIAFFLAAARLEPRAPDVRANLASALAAAARTTGDEERPEDGGSVQLSVAADEAWWLAAWLLAAGAVFGIARAIRRPSRTAGWAGAGLMIAGVALSAGLQYAAWEEARHPEAVVIVPTLPVERGPDEPSRPAVLLSAGDRVRLGEARGSQVEIRIGDNPIGWASREGLWRVADAPRYTSRFPPR